MKIWMPCSPHQIAAFIASGECDIKSGFTITPAWSAAFEDDDEEFLEDGMLSQAGTGFRVVVVAETRAEILDSSAGLVELSEPLTPRSVLAFFAKSDVADEDFSWFGPTEGANLLDFLGITP